MRGLKIEDNAKDITDMAMPKFSKEKSKISKRKNKNGIEPLLNY
jgi:hypothetical protein